MLQKFLETKKSGWYVELVSFILALITLITYVARGGNYLSPVSTSAVVVLSIGLVINAVALFKDFKVLGLLPVALYAGSAAILLNTEMLFISNVIFGVDGNSFDVAFFMFIICDILAIITSAVAFSIGLTKEVK